MKQNIIPKSLHTVTVIVAVARVYMGAPFNQSAAVSIGVAVEALGYADTPDTYELASKARAILAKSVQS